MDNQNPKQEDGKRLTKQQAAIILVGALVVRGLTEVIFETSLLKNILVVALTAVFFYALYLPFDKKRFAVAISLDPTSP